jgi:XRE family transcriptional regulator, regulator of sulfur utilization
MLHKGKKTMAPHPPEVGRTLKNLRNKRKMTLDNLSAKSGVSKSVLSKIESEQANPTVTTLWRLAVALEVPIEVLLQSDTDDRELVVLNPHQIPQVSGKDRRCKLNVLGPSELAGSVEWLELDMAAGGRLESDPHAEGAMEHLTVIEGTLQVESGGLVRDLGVGHVARYPADAPHAIRNLTDTRARGMLVIVFRNGKR